MTEELVVETHIMILFHSSSWNWFKLKLAYIRPDRPSHLSIRTVRYGRLWGLRLIQELIERDYYTSIYTICFYLVNRYYDQEFFR